ncbi:MULTISPECIES: dihydrofolate reductase [Ligilactobacillus]|uniref:Dihydrofolate reductase n=1 Tax=Ligilactobacillus animalis TaxID=1605 RepID=A0AAJ6FQ47_9LACO|nr:dihydrofolate reductase [Ligilactobacillus animalis]KDA46030.1 dihydrofolate reductase [Ligilactobacillus animalis]MBU5278471.1 dihydrofolate reductase [Ligilactobacillus animalis]MDO5882907.1 dihydrofolate reductase [Ligilactobacillus animalis]MDQ2233714.1 dihydrofolate reductase [Ligilactobacillus animalis]MDU1487407.1 dihydrofolate reductase [Ligilactobacillus animalis]
MISFIWAEDKAHHIGYQGKLPWHLPADLAFFKKQTIGHPIVMGRKTFASFPGLLPKRQHVVLTHSEELKKEAQTTERLTVFSDLTELKTWLSQQSEEVFVIGGASLFNSLQEEVERLYVTKIAAEFKGDTLMPELDYSKFRVIFQEDGVVDEKNHYPHTFYIYERK